MRLVASDLACVRGGRRVFAGVGFTVEAGSALTVTGPNGAGKSSLLRLIAGLLRPETGRIGLDGGDPELTLPEQTHYLGHQDALKPALTVLENLQFWAEFLGSQAGSASQALDRVGVGALAGLPAAYLSAGQKRRLSLARLLAAPRPVWLLDEPTAGLDAAAQAMLADLMRTHRSGGGLILAAVHGPIGLDDAPELNLADQAIEPAVLE